MFPENNGGPGQVALLVGALSSCSNIAGLIPDQGIYRNTGINQYINKWNNKLMFLSLPPSLSLSLSLKSINNFKNRQNNFETIGTFK